MPIAISNDGTPIFNDEETADINMPLQINSGIRDILVTLQNKKKWAMTNNTIKERAPEYLYRAPAATSEETIIPISIFDNLKPGLNCIVQFFS
ncbi:hypothetical protein D1Z90_20025 [Motilimonas pumila]|uniref:Uncharacterized protein n=1 Tax=Motilimonas pumila TaxID=2303987 RepID=A0A418Y9C7_9GAMM|nr:hypothetical protein D1Z90_20025 [Motilimonas pumila]